jgi:tryptophan synthase alpha chain
VAATGASGVILADLPVDEADPFLKSARTAGLAMALFVAPTTDDDRLSAVVDGDPAFIYAVAEVGVTGERAEASSNTQSLARRIRAHGDIPIVFGVGISTPAHASLAASVGDGVIVGTALVRLVLEAASGAEAIGALSVAVRDFAAAVRRDRP